ncbi:MAG: Protein of unknown function precursor [Flavipsychrobacter sp.]|nr:Protein of unknown function precursor [Flavipsychrobacter sp.]
MNRLGYFICLLIMLLPLCVFASGKEHTLNGSIKVKGEETYPYKLVFEVSHSNIKGYSLTTLPDGTDSKTSISGLLNRKQHVLIISETKLLTAPIKDMDICFVNAVLAYKKKGKNYVIAGFFQGRDSKQKPCGEGTIEFIQPVANDDLYTNDTTGEKQSGKNVVESAAKTEPVVGKDQITAGVQKQYDWNTDSCTIELWDNGVVDGDVVSLLVNDEKVLANYTLGKQRKQLKFPVTKKINTITVIAEEEGINPPNTVELMFYDGEDRYKLTAFNKKGEQATVVIRKK